MTKIITITDSKDVKTSTIIKQARKLFNVYIYDEKDIDTQFPAPEQDLVVSFLDSIESDPKHKGKSYDDFMQEDKKYMTMRQYLLVCMEKWEKDKQHIDVKYWTRTSSLWSDGGLVRGSWYDDYSKLCLNGGNRDRRHADYGPREQFSFKPSSPLTLETRVERLEDWARKLQAYPEMEE